MRSFMAVCLLLVPLSAIAQEKLNNLLIPRLLPKIIKVPVLSTRIAGNSVYAEVINRCGDGYNGPILEHSRPTNAHESTHRLQNMIRNANGRGVNAVYLIGGEAIVYKEPKVRLSVAAAMVPMSLRSPGRYQTYMLGYQRDYENEPGSMLDELGAYISGTSVILEDKQSDRSDVVDGVVEMSIYSIIVGMAAEKHDPESMAEESQFRLALNYISGKAKELYDRGSVDYPSRQSAALLNVLRTSQDTESVRVFINKYLDGVWLK